ncbi:MAG: diguanylate cyclase [Gammaproteobacteria bacterium]|nr:diguanylate cyclase [Gammaproteobacteria bacterium]
MNNKVQEKLRLLFEDYANKLPARIDGIEEQWASLQKHQDPKKLADFHREIHSLCGSSATYGYHALSQAARQLEAFLKVLMDQEIKIDSEQIQEVNFLLANLAPMSKFVSAEKLGAVSFSLTGAVDNKIIYLLDKKEAAHDFREELLDSGYLVRAQKDIFQLQKALSVAAPLVIIVDIDSFEEAELAELVTMRKTLDVSVSLLCVSHQGDLLTRLKAVRAGGSYFFQKPIDSFHLTRVLDQMSASTAKQPYRILIIDDSQSLAEYHALILQDAGMITSITTKPLEIMKVIADFQPDLLLMDIYMPDCSGIELAAVLRQQASYTSLPIIFLSTEDDRIKQLSALNIGGDDFLTKPILPQHLVSAVRSRAKRSGILSAFMVRDSLTELLNHTATLQQVSAEIKRAEEESLELSLVILDIDYFKSINDTYGHLMGDYVLRKLAESLLSQLRKTDIVGRYGGDEFVLILPKTNKEVSLQLCNRIREHFSRLNFKAEGIDFPVTFSMGIATYSYHQNAQNLVESADKAMYQAKEQGRNKVVHFDDEL